MKSIIYHVGLRVSRECINLFAKWVLHTNHLDSGEDASLFMDTSQLEDNSNL